MAYPQHVGKTIILDECWEGEVDSATQKKRKISGIVFEVHATFLTMGPGFLMSNFRPNPTPTEFAGLVFTYTQTNYPPYQPLSAYTFIKTSNDASG